MVIRDIDGTIYKEITNPAVIYDITTGELLHIGEYHFIEQLYYKKDAELKNKRKIQQAMDMCIMRIVSQEQLDETWRNNKVEVRH